MKLSTTLEFEYLAVKPVFVCDQKLEGGGRCELLQVYAVRERSLPLLSDIY